MLYSGFVYIECDIQHTLYIEKYTEIYSSYTEGIQKSSRMFAVSRKKTQLEVFLVSGPQRVARGDSLTTIAVAVLLWVT